MTEAANEKEKNVLREADDNDIVTIQDVRKYYSRKNKQAARAARRMVAKDLLETTGQPGRYKVVEYPWDKGQQTLDEGFVS